MAPERCRWTCADGAPRGTVSEAPITRMRLDGNTVDLDLQMTKLSVLSGRFASTAQMLVDFDAHESLDVAE